MPFELSIYNNISGSSTSIFDSSSQGEILFIDQHRVKQIFNDLHYNLTNNHQWQIFKSIAFVQENNIDPRFFKTQLTDFFKFYYEDLENKQGKKGAFLFLEKLKHSKHFDLLIKSIPGIPIKKQTLQNKIDFLNDLYKIHSNHLDISHRGWAGFIAKNFDIGLKAETIRQHFVKLNDQKKT